MLIAVTVQSFRTVCKVPASLLVDLAEALSVPISYFFLDLSRSDR
jgi:hypothetical protein